MFKQLIRQEYIFLALLSFGINLCFAFQLSNLSSIFKFLGAHNTELPLLWIIPPLTGLIIQPLIGQISDDTISRFGKRRPFIFGWGILAAIAFSCLPWVNTLFLAVILVWIIDCSLNGGAEGLRALTGDVLTRENERSKAFALQALASGIGGVIGASLPYFMHHVFSFFLFEETIKMGKVPTNLKLSLIAASIILTISLYFGLRNVKEKVYKHSELFYKRKHPAKLASKIRKTFQDLYSAFRKMPNKFKEICFIHSLSWVGIFIFWMYFTVTLAQNLYHLPADSITTGSAQHAALLQRASLDTSLYFSIYQYISLAYAVLLYFISQNIRIITWHACSLLIGGMGIAFMSVAGTKMTYICGICAFGIMWGSISVLPYTIALRLLPKGKMGTYLGIFNISITAPQIICGLLAAPIYAYIFKGHANYLLLTGSLFIILSAYYWQRMETQSLSATIDLLAKSTNSNKGFSFDK